MTSRRLLLGFAGLILVVGGGCLAAWAALKSDPEQAGGVIGDANPQDANPQDANPQDASPQRDASTEQDAAAGALVAALRGGNLAAARACLTPAGQERVEAAGGLARLAKELSGFPSTDPPKRITLYKGWLVRGAEGVLLVDWKPDPLPDSPTESAIMLDSAEEWVGLALLCAVQARNSAAVMALLTPPAQARVAAAGGPAALAEAIRGLPEQDVVDMYAWWASAGDGAPTCVDWIPQRPAEFAEARATRSYVYMSLKSLCSAQSLFADMDKNENEVYDYAANLKDLSDHDLIGAEVGSGKSRGYTFHASARTGPDFTQCFWAVQAIPDQPGRDRPHYMVTQEAKIYVSDRPMSLDPETFLVSGGRLAAHR